MIQDIVSIPTDPVDGFDGNFIETPDYQKSFVSKYDIRKFSKFMRATGRKWEILTKEEQKQFEL